MNNKRKAGKYNIRKIIVFFVFAIIALSLPIHFMVDEAMQNSSPLSSATQNGAPQSAPQQSNTAAGGGNSSDGGGSGAADSYANYGGGGGSDSGAYGSYIGGSYAGGGSINGNESDYLDSINFVNMQSDRQTNAELPISSIQNEASAAPSGIDSISFFGSTYTAGKYAQPAQNGTGDPQGDLQDNRQEDMQEEPPGDISVTISAIGDCTIGYDETFGQYNRFDQVYAANNRDPAYFFENVVDILSDDDLTIANLETVFTDAKKKADKTYRFKGPPEYVKILEEGSVEVVNLANNHMFDYFQKGYEDTIETLNNSSVGYFGYDNRVIIDVKGIKVGLAGFHIGGGGWSGKKKEITNALEALRPEADIVVISFHWGIEGNYRESGDQRSLAHYAIDNGADLVLGHHTHTLQPIETYKGKTIAYSLGNFCFGGNRNPKDKDTIILRQTFIFDPESLELLEMPEPIIIPASVSSVKDRNDYRPTVVEGADAERVMKKVKP